jgi:hypothetical protein
MFMKLFTVIKNYWHSLKGWQQALFVWWLAIVYIFLAGWIGIVLIPEVAGWSDGVPDNIHGEPSELPNMFIRWDAGYYLDITRNGYTETGVEEAFFPLYPLLVYLLSEINGLPARWNGLILSLFTFALASVILYTWVKHNYGHELAILATALLCFSPVSFYFVAFYAEPLFLLTNVAAIYFARRGWFIWGGIAIALAGATRSTAFLLGVVFVVEFLYQRDFSRQKVLKALVGMLLAPVGMLAYFYFLGYPDGVFAGMREYNTLLDAEWDTAIRWPWELVVSSLRAVLFQVDITPDWFSVAFTFHDMLFALGALISAFWSIRYMRVSSAALLLVSILYLFTLHGPGGYAFDSAPRRIAVIVPIYVAVAMLLYRHFPKYRWAFVLGSAVWLGVLSAWFTSGRWVS